MPLITFPGIQDIHLLFLSSFTPTHTPTRIASVSTVPDYVCDRYEKLSFESVFIRVPAPAALRQQLCADILLLLQALDKHLCPK